MQTISDIWHITPCNRTISYSNGEVTEKVYLKYHGSNESNNLFDDKSVDDISTLSDDHVMHCDENLSNRMPPFLGDSAIELEEIFDHDISNFVDMT